MKIKKREKKLSIVFRRKLLKVTAIILFISMMLISLAFPIIKNLSVNDILSAEVNDLKEQINYESDIFFKGSANFFTYAGFKVNEEEIAGDAFYMKASSWDYVNDNGVIKLSSDKSRLNKKASDYPDLNKYWQKLSNAYSGEVIVSEITDEEFKSENWTKNVAVSLGSDGMMFLGFEPENYYEQMDVSIDKICNFNSVGSEGYDIVSHRAGTIVSPPKKIRVRKDITMSRKDIENLVSSAPENTLFPINLSGTDFYAVYTRVDGYYAVSAIPKNEVMMSLYIMIIMTVFLVLLLMVIIFLRVNGLTKKLIVNNIGKINDELSEITGGNLDVEIDVNDNLEFRQLSDGINTTVSSLKGYIARESERFNKELELARAIQMSALPSVFNPYPDRHDIEIYGAMNPAKEVGGDFYDFFFTDSNHFVFLVADVSDKGIPAAMFMMKAKTIIKSLSLANSCVDEIMFIANNTLCEDNEADMFVTLWFGILDTDTGIVSYINAGHCKPLLRSGDNGFEFVGERPDFVVAGEESVPYHRRELKLNSGDALFLYTDGVTEAVDTSDELYGDERLCLALKAQGSSSAREICNSVQADLTTYSEGATQTDDITMLALVFKGARMCREITVEAKIENLNEVYDFIEELLIESGFDFGSIAKFGVIADEICANIVHYAYPDTENGMLKVTFVFDPVSDEASLTFTDNGVPFNPLNAPVPDVSNAEERDEGGLGIFLVRKFSDKVLYEYSNGENLLTIIKKRIKPDSGKSK